MATVPSLAFQLARLSDSGNQAGRASHIQLTTLHYSDPDFPFGDDPFGLMATTVRTERGRLKIIAWRLSEDGTSLVRTGDSGNDGPEVNGIAAGRLTLQRLVVATRTNQGRLQIFVWRVHNNGQTVELLGQSEAGPDAAIPDGELSLEVMNAGQVIIASRNSDGRLVLTNWSIFLDDSSVTRIADSGSAGPVVTEFATTSPFIGRVVSAVRTGQGRLRLQSWATPSNDAPTLLDQSNPAGDGRMISATFGGDAITAVRTLQGELKLIRWNGALQRRGDSGNQGGPASRTAVCALSGDRYVTAARGDGGALAMDMWEVLPTENRINRVGAAETGDLEETGEVVLERIFGPNVVTAIQDAAGRLKLIAWQPVEA